MVYNWYVHYSVKNRRVKTIQKIPILNQKKKRIRKKNKRIKENKYLLHSTGNERVRE